MNRIEGAAERKAVKGGCHCGNVLVDVELAGRSGTYNPRACDCDFCRKHGAAWVSDSKGSLLIHIQDERETRRYRQGGGNADILVCRNCGVVVCVTYRGEEGIWAAVNARALDAKFDVEQLVSPKALSDIDKVSRWRKLWFPHVRVVRGDDRPAP